MADKGITGDQSDLMWIRMKILKLLQDNGYFIPVACAVETAHAENAEWITNAEGALALGCRTEAEDEMEVTSPNGL